MKINLKEENLELKLRRCSLDLKAESEVLRVAMQMKEINSVGDFLYKAFEEAARKIGNVRGITVGEKDKIDKIKLSAKTSKKKYFRTVKIPYQIEYHRETNELYLII